MTKARKSVARKSLVVKPVETNNEVDSLREYASEAELVGQLQKQPGWEIIERDLTQYKNEISSKIAYLDPKSKEFSEARVLFISADKLFSLFNDYAENRKRALELLEKIDNTAENIILDVDN
jgi:hypothetical protein